MFFDGKLSCCFFVHQDAQELTYTCCFSILTDCNWGDHCGQVERACKERETGRGPVTVRTPYGLGVDEWAEGLEKYAKKFQAIDGVDNYDIKKK